MKNAVLAGFIIGLAALLSCSIGNPYLAAVAFSIGLLYIRIEHMPLFTGQIQKVPTKEISAKQLIEVFCKNILGVTLAMIIAFGLSFNNTVFVDNFIAAVDVKWLMPWWHYLFSGFVCGFLMTIATRPKAPLWVSSLCVAAFILGKFNHCIADWFYAPDIVLWFCVIIGNLLGGIAAVPR